MERSLFDRLADTTAFRLALLLATVPVVPVLVLGVATTVIGGAGMLFGASPVELDLGQAVFALLSAGGVLGLAGYRRARAGCEDPYRHAVTTTLAFLTAGVLAALSVAGIVAVTVAEAWLRLPGAGPAVAGALFAAANLVVAFAGIASMQRLMHRYAQYAGRPFDAMPVVLLLVAIALAIAAALITITL